MPKLPKSKLVYRQSRPKQMMKIWNDIEDITIRENHERVVWAELNKSYQPVLSETLSSGFNHVIGDTILANESNT